MNITEHSTVAGGKPAFKQTRTDSEIVAALDDILGDAYALRRAAVLLDEYASRELQRSRISVETSPVFPYGLVDEQVESIAYLTDHVRELAVGLEYNLNKAFGLGVAQ